METRAKTKSREVSATEKKEDHEKMEFLINATLRVKGVNNDAGQTLINDILQTSKAPFLYVQLMKRLKTWIQVLTPMRLGEKKLEWKDIEEKWMIPMDSNKRIYYETIEVLEQMGFIRSEVPMEVIDSFGKEEFQLQAIEGIVYLDKMVQMVDLIDDVQYKKEVQTLNNKVMSNNSSKIKTEHIPYQVNTAKFNGQKIYEFNPDWKTRDDLAWHGSVIDVQTDDNSDKESTSSNEANQNKKVNVFISPEQIPPFKGYLDNPYAAKTWLKKFEYFAENAGWNNKRRCDSIPMFLERRSQEWYDQLDSRVQRNWKSFKAAFKEFYCSGEFDQSRQAAYYQATQFKNESPIEFLIRFNALAKKANIDFKNNRRSAKEHVRNFIGALKDQELVNSLPGYLIRNADELYQILREQKITSMRRKSEIRANVQKKFKPEDEKADSKADNKKRVHFTKEMKSKYRNGNDSSDSNDENDSEYNDSDEYEDASDHEKVFQMEERKYTNNYKKPMENKRCATCNSSTHDSNNCWKSMKCTACGTVGHPMEKCFKVCKSCSKVHDNGVCIYKEISEWVQQNHLDNLPDELKKHLNL